MDERDWLWGDNEAGSKIFLPQLTQLISYRAESDK